MYGRERKLRCNLLMLFSPERLTERYTAMTDNTVVSLNTPQDPLTELIRQGARNLIAQAVEAEL